MKRIKVMVSPFYGGEEWVDAGTGILFKNNRAGDTTIYSIPEDANLAGIRKAIQLNTLFLVEGTLEDLKNEVEAPKEDKEEKVEVAEKVEEEAKAEEKKPAPAKKKQAKK